MIEGETWTDFVVWETLEDAYNATTVGEGFQITENFYAMIQLNTCKALISTLVKNIRFIM